MCTRANSVSILILVLLLHNLPLPFMFFFLMIPRPLIPTLFPYTTLFRSDDRAVQASELAISSPLLEASIDGAHGRSEEHTSELQSRGHLVCRLLLEKKKTALVTIENDIAERIVDETAATK